MEIRHLFEKLSPQNSGTADKQRAFSNLALSLLMKYSMLALPKISKSIYFMLQHDLGNVKFSDLSSQKKNKDNHLSEWIRSNPDLNVTFIPDSKEYGGYYDATTNNISLCMNEYDVKEIRKLRTQEYVIPRYLFEIFENYKGILIHELTHAYEDWISAGMYRQNKRSKADDEERLKNRNNPDFRYASELNSSYMTNPIEISARFYQTIEYLKDNGYLNKDWRTSSFSFAHNYRGWRFIEKSEKNQLIKRFAKVWMDNQPKRKPDYTADVAQFNKKLSENYSEYSLLYYKESSNSLRLSFWNDVINYDLLKQVIRFGQIRKMVIGIEQPVTPELKALGFINNKGRNKDFRLSWSVKAYIPARKSLTKA